MEGFSKAMNRAMYYLGKQIRSRKEVSTYLARKETEPEVMEAVLDRLEKLGYLNDQYYAERFAAARIKKGGSFRVSMELRGKGISAEDAQAALEQIDPAQEEQSALRYAERALRGETDDKARRRAYAALSRRGYSGELIRRVMEQALGELS